MVHVVGGKYRRIDKRIDKKKRRQASSESKPLIADCRSSSILSFLSPSPADLKQMRGIFETEIILGYAKV